MLNPTTNQIERNIADDNIIKEIRNLFQLKKKKDSNIKDKVIRDKRTLFDSDEEDYYEPVRTDNAFSSNYIEYKSNGDKHKTLSIEEYLDKIRPYLNNIINHFKNPGRMENSNNNGK